MILHLVLCLGGIAVLWLSSDLVVRHVPPIARRLGVNELMVTILGVSVFSSLPEFSVSALAALKGNADLSLGNVVGSNFVTLTFVTALCAMIAPMNLRQEIRDRESSWMILSTIVVLLLATDRVLSRIDGLILIGMYIPYVMSVISDMKRQKSVEVPVVEEDSAKKGKVWISVLVEAAAILGVVISAGFALKHGEIFGEMVGIPSIVLGAVLFAFGTSLPELAIAVSATLKKKAEISMGEIYSSNIFTALCVLGLCAVITPLSIGDARILNADIPFLLLAGVVVQLFVTTGLVFNRIEAGLVILLYLYFVLVHFVPSLVPWKF